MIPTNAKIISYPVIPEGEQKCIWMINGSVSYKLCDRNYDCENCPFYQGIKSGEYGEELIVEGSVTEDPSTKIDRTVFYDHDHCWVKLEDSGKAKIGLDYLLSRLITDVKIAVLPQIGCVVTRGECCAHIIKDDYILPVISPISGHVVAVNSRLQKEPGLVTSNSQQKGWLMMIKPDNLERDLRGLIFGRNALAWYQREEKKITNCVETILKRNPQSVGLTMQDGGVRIEGWENLLDTLNPKQRAQILDFYIAGIKNHKE